MRASQHGRTASTKSLKPTLVLDEDGLAGGDHREGGVIEGVDVELELDTGEVGRDTIPADRERAGRDLAVQDGAVLEDLKILRARVGNSSGDLDVVDGVDVGRGCPC